MVVVLTNRGALFMKINNLGMQPSIDGLPHGLEAGKGAEAESFQARLSQLFAQSVKEAEGQAAGRSAPPDQVSAIAARSRVQRETGGDFTDFLGLIGKTEYLLPGVDVGGELIREGKPTPLSAREAKLLREQYDAGNLPPEEQYALFRRLTELGALSAEDVRRTQLSVMPGEDDLIGLASAPEFRDVAAVPETKPRERLEVMIHNERFAYSNVLSRFGQRCVQVDELADSHQKVLDTLKQI